MWFRVPAPITHFTTNEQRELRNLIHSLIQHCVRENAAARRFECGLRAPLFAFALRKVRVKFASAASTKCDDKLYVRAINTELSFRSRCVLAKPLCAGTAQTADIEIVRAEKLSKKSSYMCGSRTQSQFEYTTNTVACTQRTA